MAWMQVCTARWATMISQISDQDIRGKSCNTAVAGIMR